MGYTHYWSSTVRPTDTQWDVLTAAVHAVFAIAEKTPGFPATTADGLGEKQTPERAEIHEDVILFNGLGEDAHETFVLERDPEGFSFCKTARKPYDLVATIVMVLAHHHCPGVWDFSSDGGRKACEEAMDWLAEHGFEPMANPITEE